MACTLQALQDVEYEILCKFADFCDANRIPYGLSGGTLLGAIRHNGFIPWDDDVDVHMEIHAFRKFLRCYRRHPIPGLHLSWIDSDGEYPHYFAKLRRNGTFMPEELNGDFDQHNGVWIDIFVYHGVPNNRFLFALQQKLYFIFATAARMHANTRLDRVDHVEFDYSRQYRLLAGMSRKSLQRVRRLFFFLYGHIGSRRSEYICYNDWHLEPKEKLPRSFELPLTKHVFRDREFSIPQNYDAALTKQYGNYMKPVMYPSHTKLTHVELDAHDRRDTK